MKSLLHTAANASVRLGMLVSGGLGSSSSTSTTSSSSTGGSRTPRSTSTTS